MPAPTYIGDNVSDEVGYNLNRTQNKVTGTDFYSKVSYASSLSGPVTVASLAAADNENSAAITAAAVNEAAGYGYGTGLGTTPGVYSGGVSNYYSPALGATTLSGTTTASTSEDMLGMAQQQLADSQSSSIAMLMIQDEMGRQNRLYTSSSNLMNSRDTMLATIIRNVRVG